MKVLFILNPVAGKKKSLKAEPLIENKLKEYGIEGDIVRSERPGHAKEIALRASEQGYTRVVSVGGDGTVNEIINGIINLSNITFGLVPAGTGNDLAKSINVPMDLEKSIEVALKGKVKEIDIGKLGERYFVNVASVGFDAEVALNMSYFKRYLSGIFAYLGGVLKTLIANKSTKAEIEIDGASIVGDIFLIAVGNGKYYGGGMKVTPKAEVDDGLFDICIIDKVSRLKVLKLLPKFIKGEHESIKEVSMYKGKVVSIKTLEKKMVNLDGELIDGTPVTFECLKGAINIVTE